MQIEVLLNERDEIAQFLMLTKMLNSVQQSVTKDNIPEINFLNEFENMSRFPSESFTCKDIILSVMDRYKKQKSLRTKSRHSPYLQRHYVYIFQNQSLTIGCYMNFYFDLVYICCLHCLACTNVCTRPIKFLISMMTTKYDLKHDYDEMINNDPKALTMYRIARCFPSITVAACKTITSSTNNVVLLHFPDTPLALLNPYVLYTIPNVDGIPTALILYIMISLREHYFNSEDQILSVATYYKILQYACSDNVFPECFKLALHKKWQTIKKTETQYIFDECLTAYCKKAKSLIRKIKPNDVTIKHVLSKL